MRHTAVRAALIALAIGLSIWAASLRAQTSPSPCSTCYEWDDKVNTAMPKQAQCCTDGSDQCFIKQDNTITGAIDQPFCWIIAIPEGWTCVAITCDDGGGGAGGGGGGGGTCVIGPGDGCPAECPSCSRQKF
jgi:hypothetical protein